MISCIEMLDESPSILIHLLTEIKEICFIDMPPHVATGARREPSAAPILLESPCRENSCAALKLRPSSNEFGTERQSIAKNEQGSVNTGKSK